MKVHETLPVDDIAEKYTPAFKPLEKLRYGVFFLPENRGKTLEVIVVPPGTKSTADFRISETAFRTQVGAYVRTKSPLAKRFPELQTLNVSIRKSKSKSYVFYVTVTTKKAQ